MKAFDVVGFGALNVDKLFRVNRIAEAEEESFVTGFEETCGGSAANTILGLAKLGFKVGFIGNVASDREGRMLLEDFQKEDVDTSGIRIAKHGRSGVVMGFVDEKGERALYIDAGVNDGIKFEEMDLAYVSGAKFLHLTSFVGETSFQTQKKLIERLPKNVNVSFDPGALYAQRGIGELEPIIEKSFILLPNAIELKLLTGLDDYKKGAEVMLKSGVQIVSVKLGSKGCYVANGIENHSIEAFKVNVVDTTGAGDAFDAGFLYGLLSNKSLYECGRIGNFVASRCVMRMGARVGLPRLKDLEFSC